MALAPRLPGELDEAESIWRAASGSASGVGNDLSQSLEELESPLP